MMEKNNLKKILKCLCFVCIICALIINCVGIPAFAKSSNSSVSSVEDSTGCPLPRNTGTQKDEDFIQFIEDELNISRNDENVFIQYNGNGTVSISIIDSNDQITIYTNPTEEESEFLKDYNEKSKGLLWSAIVLLWKVADVYGLVEFGCKVVEGVSGVDVCGYVGNEIIDTIVKAGQTKKCRVIRYVEKKPCPYPPHSLQCNEPPFAYWKTVVKEY